MLNVWMVVITLLEIVMQTYTDFKTVRKKYTNEEISLAIYDFYYEYEIYNVIDYDGFEPSKWQIIKAVKEYYGDDSIILKD
jgi:hypothetical protein